MFYCIWFLFFFLLFSVVFSDYFFFFFFNDTATTEIYTLSLHDALPIPSQARPPDSTSSVVTALTRRPGGRYVTPVTMVPSRIRSVCAARKPSVVYASSMSDWSGAAVGSAWIR